MEKSLKEIRKYLHQYPELSHQEINTSQFIKEQILLLDPDDVIALGDYSQLFVFDSDKPGAVLVFRADMDGLPIAEKNTFKHRSKNKNCSHVCGHDGHSTILIGMARKIAKNRPQKGKIGLLFQSAEETGKGAKAVVNHPAFKALKPDCIFGFHNIPGFPLGQILLRKGVFASASKGMILKLIGRTSHAAEPEKGINPALAMAEITHQLNLLNTAKGKFSSLSLLTFIYSRMGEIAFGTSAGKAEMGFTLRSFESSDMELLCSESEKRIEEVCRQQNLSFNIEYVEEFPITQNDKELYSWIHQAAKSLGHSIKVLDEPMKWSEDFGYYREVCETGFFGIGAGLEHANLHDPSYDFPDKIIDTTIQTLDYIYRLLVVD